ncbi:MAG: gliding motility-associated C-terminal domain-containing protein [Crocinitomicaceae bacterium]
MKKTIFLFFVLLFVGVSYGQCDPTVPLYTIDISNNPDTTWTLLEVDALDRNGQCCSADPNEACIQFEITLHPDAAGIFFDYDGAGAYGSLAWQLDCGPEYNLKDTICYTGSGTFTLTFCKPGSDNGNYTLVSVPKPTFPEDQYVPLNCAQPVEVLGVTASSIQWQSVYINDGGDPTGDGDQNGQLSCTDCLDPVFTPDHTGPDTVAYLVSGYPILDYCVGNFLFTDTVLFISQDSIELEVTPANPTFCSGGTVDLTANATGGDGNFTYYWYDGSLNPLDTGAVFVADTAGTYTVEVRDGNYDPIYCDNFTLSTIVVETLLPSVSAGGDQLLCADNPDATLSGTITYATGGVWTGGAGTFTPSDTDLNAVYMPTQAELDAGSVTLTLTSTGAGSSCTNMSDDVELIWVDTIQTTLTDQTLGCFGSTVTLNPTISGGTGTFTYSWTTGDITQSAEVGAGTHCLTITDDNGCTATECATITTPTELNLSLSSTPESAVPGSDGTATATPSGGTSPYTYAWSNAGTNQTETGLVYGIYTVTVTDDNGCTRTGSVVVNNTTCGGFGVSATASDVLCFSDSTGSVAAVVSGGTGPYNYAWNDYDSQTTATAVNLPAGTYEVVVEDQATGCFAVVTASVFEPSELLNSITHTDVTTQGGSDGTALTNPIGGSTPPPYDYSWSTGDITANISGVPTGWYYVDITDGNGCLLEDSVFISEPPCNEFYLYTSTTSPLCNGDLTGEADLTILNGVGPYSITWSTGESDVTSITGAPGGIHSVEVTDSRGCYSFLNYGISEPSPLSIGLNPTSSTCNGFDNGTIDMTVSGGTYPYYYYNWSNGSTSEDIINLAPGAYSVQVSDENGCIASANTSLTDPDVLDFSFTVTNVTCFLGTDGAIDVTPIGGTLPYSYSWSNGATTEDLTGIDVGGYILNIIDGNACDFDEPVTIIVTEPAVVEADTIIVNCPVPGSTTTIVDVTPIGGTANYAVSTDGGTTYGVYGDYTLSLTIGQTYDIMIKDVNDCESKVYVTVIDDAVVVDDVTFNPCYSLGQTDEVITASVSGGTADYFISTDNGGSYGAQGVYTATVGINASYDVVAMDDKGCVSLPFSISLPDVFDMSIAVTSNYNGQDISCNGQADGEATATVTGGTVGYTYTWSNGGSSAINSGLIAGNYTLTVEDANGCSINDNITINEPTALTQSITSATFASGDNITCNGAADGSIDYTVGGGTTGYTYAWTTADGTGLVATDEDQSGLTAGTYDVTVTDVNGCSLNTSITLVEPTVMTQSITSATYSSGDNITCNGAADGSIDYTVNGASPSYTYAWSTADGTGLVVGDEDQSGLTAGTYDVTVTDVNGCSLNTSITLVEPTVMTQSITSATYVGGDNITCNGAADGSIDYTVNGASPGYTYAWSTADGTGLVATDEDQSGLTAGTYDVTVTDVNGCSLNTSITLVEPSALTHSISSPMYANGHHITCFSYNDGSIDYTVNGGSTAYTYAWSTSDGSGLVASDEDQANITAGTYDVTVTDVNGCSLSTSITLTEPTGMTQSISSATYASGDNITCNGAADGSIDYTVGGGSPAYTYAWTTTDGSGLNATAEDQSGLTAGTYTVVVTDLTGCTRTETITLVEPTAMTQSITAGTFASGDNISCNGLADGSIDYTVGDGSPGYTFAWTSADGTGLVATDEDQSGLTAGTYDVTTTDINGCTVSESITLVEPTELTSTIAITSDYNGQDISCNNAEDGEAEVTPAGGSTPYTYDWSNGQTTQTATGLTEGVYNVEVTDVNGCTTTNLIVLTQPDELTVDLYSPLNFHNHHIDLFGGDDGQIDATVLGGTPEYDYIWSNNSVEEDQTGLTAGYYMIEVYDVNGCYAQDTIYLTQPFELELPSAFSPNGDNANDIYDIHGIEAYPDNRFIVLNRWGNVVFETESYHNVTNFWSGESNQGNQLPDGVYFVLLEIDGGDLKRETYVHIKTH